MREINRELSPRNRYAHAGYLVRAPKTPHKRA